MGGEGMGGEGMGGEGMALTLAGMGWDLLRISPPTGMGPLPWVAMGSHG